MKEKNFSLTKQKIAALFLWIVAIAPSTSQAALSYSYFIDRDENGFFIQTELDGSYYLDIGSTMHVIRKGQVGYYDLITEGNAKYLVTSHHGKFFIGSSSTGDIEDNQGYSDISTSLRETKIVINGDQILVPVKIKVGAKKIETLLLLDTGATTVVLHTDLAKKLKLRAQKKSRIRVAGGNTIVTDVGILGSMAVGPILRKNLTVCIVDSHNGVEPYEGFLGMNFLSNTNYRIDFKKQVIIWD